MARTRFGNIDVFKFELTFRSALDSDFCACRQLRPPEHAAERRARLQVKHYETKQYKKGLKAADQVLKEFPTTARHSR